MTLKKLALFGAITAVFAGSAQAQSSVSIYGILDAGLVSVDGVGTSNGRATQFLNGGQVTSRLGFRGTEDLGQGLSSGFQLESQVMPGTGTTGTTATAGGVNGMFSRQANVFLNHKEFGKLTLGRTTSSAYQAFQANGDAHGFQNTGASGIFLNDGSSFGGTATAKTGLSSLTGGLFVSNSVRYDSPELYGFKANIQYIPGGYADSDAGNAWSNGLQWSKYGFTASAGQYRANSTTGAAAAQTEFYAANYKWKDYGVFAGQVNMKNPSAESADNGKFTLNSYGATWQTSPKVSVTGAYYTLQDKVTTANKNNSYAATVNYDLSKRTRVYTTYAVSKNQGAEGFAAYGGGSANINTLATANYPSVISNTGISQTALAVGIRHSF
jgi:predicted porin